MSTKPPAERIASSVSIVMPAFNEEDNIEFMLAACVETLEELTEDWEIIVVDDASHDRTAQRAGGYAAPLPEGRVRVLRNPRNIGCHPSEILGLLAARGEYRLFISSDRQILPTELRKFLPAIRKGADLVYSWRLPRVDPLHRRLISKVYNLVERLMLGISLHDTHSAVLARRRVVEAVGPELVSHSAAIPAELAVRALAHGFRIDEVVIEHHPRTRGTPTGINLRDVMRVPGDLFRFWRTLRAARKASAPRTRIRPE